MSDLQRKLDQQQFNYFVIVRYMEDREAYEKLKEYFEKNNLPVLIFNQLSKAFIEGYNQGVNMAKAKKAKAVKKPAKKIKK